MSQIYTKNSLILIVEDDKELIQIIASSLNTTEIELAFAMTGTSAFESIEAKKPDLIVLDIQLPDTDGYTIAGKLKSNPETANIPIIFCTSQNSVEDIKKGFLVGGVDYVSKPIVVDELISRVKVHLKLKNAEEDLKLKNDELEKNNAELETQIQLKSFLYSVVAHDLNSPMQYIQMYAKQLQEGIDTISAYEMKRKIEFIAKSSGHAGKLLSSLTDWIHAQSTKFTLTKTRFNLHNLVEEKRNAFLDKAHEKSISIYNNVLPDEMIEADETIVSTLIRNLIQNALKFTNRNGSVLIQSERQDNNLIVIKIIDTGVGMPQSIIDSMFRSTIRQNTSGTENEPGFGMGLQICNELLNRHNKSYFKIQSEVGSGSSFDIYLNC